MALLAPRTFLTPNAKMLSKGRKSSNHGVFSQGQLLEKVNLEPDLQDSGGHGWSPRKIKEKGAGKCAFPVKHMKLSVWYISKAREFAAGVKYSY